MRSTLPSAAAAALLVLSLVAPGGVAAAQAERGGRTSSDRAQAERSRREAERAARAADRAREREDMDDDEDDDDQRSARRGGAQERSSIDTTVAFARGGVVDLSLVSGQIRVTGWTRNEVKVRARSEGRDLRFEATPSRITLDLDRGRGHGHDDEAEYELSVPEGTRVLMRSTSGDLAARGVKGEVEARSVSGSVEVQNAGRSTLESVSGDVRASGLSGAVRAHSVSGEVALQDVTGDLDVETVSGDIELRRATARVVRAESVSGELTFEGPVDPAGRYDLRSHSGTIRLMLPESTSAAFSVETFSGEIDSDFRITLRPTGNDSGRARRMEFTLGRGGPRVVAETFSGDVEIKRR